MASRPLSALKENSLATASSRLWPFVALYSSINCFRCAQLRAAKIQLKVPSSVPNFPSPWVEKGKLENMERKFWINSYLHRTGDEHLLSLYGNQPLCPRLFHPWRNRNNAWYIWNGSIDLPGPTKLTATRKFLKYRLWCHSPRTFHKLDKKTKKWTVKKSHKFKWILVW